VQSLVSQGILIPKQRDRREIGKKRERERERAREGRR
jgi:hypothetical protein